MAETTTAIKSYNIPIQLKRGTTAEWNIKRFFVPLKGQPVVYTDYKQTTDSEGNVVNIPGIKIGDGKVPVIDLPFMGQDQAEAILRTEEKIDEHVADEEAHVSTEDRAQMTQMQAHMENDGIHLTAEDKEAMAEIKSYLENPEAVVTAEERERWNKQLTLTYDDENENLILAWE